MSTSTSTSNATPLPRIKLNQSGATGSGQRTYTGKHPPPGHSSRSNGSGTNARPPPLPSPTPSVSGGNGGGANGVNANPAGARISERRRANNKAGGPGKLKGGNTDNRVKGAGGGNEAESVPRLAKKLGTKPYVNTTSVILQKYQGQPPSIVLHLHPQNFRFDGQDGGFSYASPMRVILECLRSEIIPHEVVEEFRDAGTKFYDGCLIVQIHDHRSASTTSSSKANDNKVVPHSIHNHNEYLTPSPFAPFPREKLVAPERGGGQSTVSQGQAVGSDRKDASLPLEAKKEKEEKEEKTEKKIRIFTTVLHPTQLTLHADMAVMASTPVPSRLNSYSRPQQSSSTLATPTSASMPVPPTPTGLTINTSPGGLSTKTVLNDRTALNFEAATLLATSPALVLTPAKDPEHAQTILRTLRNPHNSFPMPPPKSRKRTTAELAADEAQAIQEERLLLIMDERHSGHTSLAPESAVGDGASGNNGFEPDFKKLKLIQSIRTRLEEERKAKDRLQRQEMEQRNRENRKLAELEATRRAAASRASQHGSPVLAQGPAVGAATTAAQVSGTTATARPGSSGSVQSQSGQQVNSLRLQQHLQRPQAHQQQAQQQQQQAQAQAQQQQPQAQQVQQTQQAQQAQQAQQQAQQQVQQQVQQQAQHQQAQQVQQQAQQQTQQQQVQQAHQAQQAHLGGQQQQQQHAQQTGQQQIGMVPQPQMQHHAMSQPGANTVAPVTATQYTLHMQQQQHRMMSQQHAQQNSQSPRPHHQSPHLAQQSPHLTHQSPHLAQQSPHLQHSSPRMAQHPTLQQQQQMQLQILQQQQQLQGGGMNNTNVNGARATMIGKTTGASLRPGHHVRQQQLPQQQGHQFQDLGGFALGGNGIAMGGGGMHQLPPGVAGQMPQGMGQNMIHMVNMRNGAQGMGGRGASRP